MVCSNPCLNYRISCLKFEQLMLMKVSAQKGYKARYNGLMLLQRMDIG